MRLNRRMTLTVEWQCWLVGLAVQKSRVVLFVGPVWINYWRGLV